MDMTIHHTNGLSLIQHKKLDGLQTYFTTLVIKHRDGELRLDLFSDQTTYIYELGEADE
jgi:hypothetical protein